MRRDAQDSFKAYQLKDSPTASWTAGTPSIADDFAMQQTIARAEGYADIRLRLVCSDTGNTAALAGGVPAAIAGFSKAIFFPSRAKIPQLQILRDYGWFMTDFAYLSRNDHAGLAEVGNVVSVVMGAWETLAPSALVSEVFEKARDMSPTLLRSARSDADARARLSAEFAACLGAIPDFSYDVSRGFLRWTAAGGTTNGILSHDCFTDWFDRLQRQIVARNPQSFEDIEGMLL